MNGEWKQYSDGLRWQIGGDGCYEVEGYGVRGSGGQPLTMRLLVKEYGDTINKAAQIANVPREWIAAMITVEAIRLNRKPRAKSWKKARRYLTDYWRSLFSSTVERNRRHRLLFDPISLRKEPGYLSPEITPSRISAGLCQVLLSTAREQAKRAGLKTIVTIDGHEFDISMSQALIFDPTLSIITCALYMRWQIDRYSDGIEGHEFDFVHMTGAYNAGSVKRDPINKFRLMTYSPIRTAKALRYLNDCYDPSVQALWGDK